LWIFNACNIHFTSDLWVAVPNFGSPPRRFLGFIPTQTASQHLTAPARLSCRRLNGLNSQLSCSKQPNQLQQIVSSNCSLSALFTILLSTGKGQCSVCPGTCASSCLFHDHLHQIVSLDGRVSSVATTSQLSCKLPARWLTRLLLLHFNRQSTSISKCAQAAEPIISWPSSSNCQLSCGSWLRCRSQGSCSRNIRHVYGCLLHRRVILEGKTGLAVWGRCRTA